MKRTSEQVKGIVENILFQNSQNGYTVAEIMHDGDHVTVVGYTPSLCPGEMLTAEGTFTVHSSYGRQLNIESYTTELPTEKNAITYYLAGGAIKGIGPVTASRIVERFGEDTFAVMSTEPEQLAVVSGISAAKAKQIGDEFNKVYGLKEAIVSLGTMGVSAQVAVAAYNQYGTEAAHLMRENAYIMCEPPIMMDFRLADKIAQQFAVEYDTRERLIAAIYYVFRHNTNNNGHCCLPNSRFVPTVAGFVGIEQERIQELVEQEFEAGRLILQSFGDKDFIFLPEFHDTERDIALRLLALKERGDEDAHDIDARIDDIEQSAGITYAPLQRRAIGRALTQGVFVLSGGPGTGKTTTVNAIITLLEQSMQRVALVAPTGRAAKRMSDLCARPASTIHRLLEVSFTKGEQLKFNRNESNPLKLDVVVVDEMSMVDVFLFQALLKALPKKARLIMIGDFDQLPSVGPGCLLRSIMESGAVDCVSLTEIFRQSQNSLIVKNAHRIVNGQLPQFNNKTGDFYFIEQAGEAAQQTVLGLAQTRLAKKYGYSPIYDIQVLCATKVGPAGTVALNPMLQAILNPPSAEKPEMKSGGRTFRIGDKVMQIKNDYDIEFEREDGSVGAGIYNGDIGFVVNIDKRMSEVHVRVDDRVYRFVSEQLSELELAYAITIHKSQGSEFTAVIMPLTEVPKRLCYLNLLYTGVTRAKELLVIVGEQEILATMLADKKSSYRFSMVKEFLNEAEK